MKKQSSSIYVVDDDPAMLRSIKRLLSGMGFQVATFSTAHEFLDNYSEEEEHSCLILDVSLPDISGIKLQEELISRGIDLPIVFITGYGDIPMSVKAMKQGAIDFLPKPFKEKDLLAAISRAVEKDIAVHLEKEEKERLLSIFNILTPREYEVMRLVITGLLNKQIALQLGITERTVKVHRGRVMEKMQIDSLAELVILALKAGISPIEK